MRDSDDAALIISHPKDPSAFTSNHQQSGVTEVDNVVHQPVEGLRDSQPHHALEPQHQLMDRTKVCCDLGALREVQRAQL